MLDTLEVLNIWRDEWCREVVHTFVEACMERDFDSFGVKIIP
jgi:hypothetical protein